MRTCWEIQVGNNRHKEQFIDYFRSILGPDVLFFPDCFSVEKTSYVEAHILCAGDVRVCIFTLDSYTIHVLATPK